MQRSKWEEQMSEDKQSLYMNSHTNALQTDKQVGLF